MSRGLKHSAEVIGEKINNNSIPEPKEKNEKPNKTEKQSSDKGIENISENNDNIDKFLNADDISIYEQRSKDSNDEVVESN